MKPHQFHFIFLWHFKKKKIGQQLTFQLNRNKTHFKGGEKRDLSCFIWRRCREPPVGGKYHPDDWNTEKEQLAERSRTHTLTHIDAHTCNTGIRLHPHMDECAEARTHKHTHTKVSVSLMCIDVGTSLSFPQLEVSERECIIDLLSKRQMPVTQKLINDKWRGFVLITPHRISCSEMYYLLTCIFNTPMTRFYSQRKLLRP